MSNLSWRPAGIGKHAGPRVSIWRESEEGMDSYLVGFAHFDYLTRAFEFEKLQVESEGDTWTRAQAQKWNDERIYKEFSARALSQKRIESLDVAEVQAFVANLPADALDIVVPENPKDRKPIAPPDPFKPVAVRLPDVTPISFRDPETLERIRLLEDRFESHLEVLEADIKAIKEWCTKEHGNLSTENNVTRSHLNAHMKNPHHWFSHGGGFLAKQDDNDDAR